MAEQLFRVCPECGGRGYIETKQRIEISPENEFAIRASCVACSDTGYLPVDAPEPLTGEELVALEESIKSGASGPNGHTGWAITGPAMALVTNVIAALPARFGVRMEGTTDET